MSNPINDGGSFHPCQPLDVHGNPIGPMDCGASLREWFAGQALAGMLANPTIKQIDQSVSGETALAIQSYAIADAMLATRKVKP